jgi:hypothetical protein
MSLAPGEINQMGESVVFRLIVKRVNWSIFLESGLVGFCTRHFFNINVALHSIHLRKYLSLDAVLLLHIQL